jgi:hypothetical protein
MERLIDHIVHDIVLNRLGISVRWLPRLTRGIAQAQDDFAVFERLTDLVLATRKEGKGLWNQFKIRCAR